MVGEEAVLYIAGLLTISYLVAGRRKGLGSFSVSKSKEETEEQVHEREENQEIYNELKSEENG